MSARRYKLAVPTGPSSSSIDYAVELNDQQLEVVMAESGPMLVIAGAGSGKTRTVTYRLARLIESGENPGRILLLTFTNKAAGEMLRRAEGLVRANVRHVWGGPSITSATSFCAGMRKQSATAETIPSRIGRIPPT